MKTIESILKHAEQIGKEPGKPQDQRTLNLIKIGMRVAINEVQKWIPVEIENPPVDEDLEHYSYVVEVKNGNKIQSSFFNFETGQWRSIITGIIINPTHWRLIEIE